MFNEREPDLLDDLAKAVRDSADQHGTSNGPVSRWVDIATIQIQTQERKIKELEGLLFDVMQNHGLTAGY